MTKVLTGLLAGATLGVAVALVIASDKDNKLKEKVRHWFGNLFDNSKDKLSTP